MASSEAMTSSTHSLAYSYRCFQMCFVKTCETSKCHNFLIFQTIFIKFSLFCSKFVTLSSEIKLNLFWISPFNWLYTCARTIIHIHSYANIDTHKYTSIHARELITPHLVIRGVSRDHVVLNVLSNPMSDAQTTSSRFAINKYTVYIGSALPNKLQSL